MISIPKGTKDLLPQYSYKWHYVEGVCKAVAKNFNISEIRTPVFEHTELFLRGVGDTTDVVSKEMYTFLDKGNRSITLKPEGTAGVARSYIESGLGNLGKPLKMYYVTPVFRYERPQAGRLRQHHQFGIEFYGSESALIDAEVISVAHDIFLRLGVKSVTLNINSIGCPTCRDKYNAALKEFLQINLGNMCQTCNERIDKNPLRILDCKEPACSKINEKAPVILDYICEECRNHFEALKKFLVVKGIPFEIDCKIVRGLDYYTKTVFEFVTDTLGAKSTVCGGGRYDGLVESVGGKSTPAVGFGMGLERLLLMLDSQGIEIENTENILAFIAYANDSMQDVAITLASKLRHCDIPCDYSEDSKAFKSQFKQADRLGAMYVIVIGEEEIAKKKYTLKNMKSGEQILLSENELFNCLKENR